MADENYKIQVSFFTRDNVASLEQFRDNISRLSSNLKAQIDAKSQAKGGAGVFAGILMGAIMGRALGRARSSLGKMNNELRETREKNIYKDPYVKGLEKTNEALEKKMMQEVDAARSQGIKEGRSQGAKTLNRATSRMKSQVGNLQKQLQENESMKKSVESARKEGYDAASKEAAKRAFEKTEKRPLESAQRARQGGFDFTSEAKENRRKVIQANMEAHAEKVKNSKLNLQNKELTNEAKKNRRKAIQANMEAHAEKVKNSKLNLQNKELTKQNKELIKESKWKSDIYKIEMNENIENQKKLSALEKKISESKVARSLGQQTRRNREKIQMGKEPESLSQEAQDLQKRRETAADLVRQQKETMWQKHETVSPVEPPDVYTPIQKPVRKKPRTEKQKDESRKGHEEDERLPQMRRNEQLQTAQGDY
jgi:hypothetical protein